MKKIIITAVTMGAIWSEAAAAGESFWCCEEKLMQCATTECDDAMVSRHCLPTVDKKCAAISSYNAATKKTADSSPNLADPVTWGEIKQNTPNGAPNLADPVTWGEYK